MPRAHGKPDGSAKEIDEWMQLRGATIMRLDSLGDGWPDRCYGMRGENILVELKSKTGKLSDKQATRRLTWHGAPIHMWKTIEDAAKTLRELGMSV